MSICMKNSSETNRPATQHGATSPTPGTNSTTQLNSEASKFSPSTTSSMYAGTNAGVLLQTAKTLIYNPDNPQSSVEVRVI